MFPVMFAQSPSDETPAARSPIVPESEQAAPATTKTPSASQVREPIYKDSIAARFDDLVVVGVTTIKAKGARIWHEYKVYRDDDLLVEGKSVVACVDATGRPKPLPKYLRTTP